MTRSRPAPNKIYDDVKLLNEELNKHAESENYAVVIARFKKVQERC